MSRTLVRLLFDKSLYRAGYCIHIGYYMDCLMDREQGDLQSLSHRPDRLGERYIQVVDKGATATHNTK